VSWEAIIFRHDGARPTTMVLYTAWKTPRDLRCPEPLEEGATRELAPRHQRPLLGGSHRAARGRRTFFNPTRLPVPSNASGHPPTVIRGCGGFLLSPIRALATLTTHYRRSLQMVTASKFILIANQHIIPTLTCTDTIVQDRSPLSIAPNPGQAGAICAGNRVNSFLKPSR